MLKHHWASADRRTMTAQIVFPWSKVKKVLAKLRGVPLGGHLGVNKTLDKVRQWYYQLNSRSNIERWYQKCDTCTASGGP
jgi:hypothetical protein